MPPKITIVIPTRERHDTLQWALKTCTNQDYDRLEIVVSDNASVDSTREVVESFSDRRIRYVNPGRRVSMSDNWEFAISHVTGGFVGVIGDDDGVMPGGVATMASVLADDRAASALIWPVYSYYWPGYVDPTIANCLSMPVRQTARVEKRISSTEVRQVVGFRDHAHRLPSPYWGVVAHAAIQRARDSRGRFFRSITPDIYAGIAIAAVSHHHLWTDRALTLSGESRHSNAASQITGAGTESEVSPARVFMRENANAFHRNVQYAANIPVLIGEALLQARDHLDGDLPELDVKAMLIAAIMHPDHLFNAPVRDDVVAALAVTADQHGIGAWFAEQLEATERRHKVHFAVAAMRSVTRGPPVRACPSTVSNIYDACTLADGMLTSRRSESAAALSDIVARLAKLGRGIRSLRSRHRRSA